MINDKQLNIILILAIFISTTFPVEATPSLSNARLRRQPAIAQLITKIIVILSIAGAYKKSCMGFP